MNRDEIESLGAALAKAKREGGMIPAPAGWPPSPIDAEAIRERAIAAMGEPVTGWKIGATSPEAQKMLQCDGPVYGPLFQSATFASGEAIPLTAGTLGAECEFAFRIAADQPAGQAGHDRETITALVQSCHPAIEIVGRRVASDGFPPVSAALADFGMNVAFIHGPAIPDDRSVDLAAAPVRGLVDGEETNAGHGRNVLGHPLNALAWLANALAERGDGLKAGDWVTTGTCLGVVPVKAGSTVTGDFGDLGAVRVEFRA